MISDAAVKDEVRWSLMHQQVGNADGNESVGGVPVASSAPPLEDGGEGRALLCYKQ